MSVELQIQLLYLYGKLRTNLRHVSRELSAWRAVIIPAARDFLKAVAAVPHEAMNLVTETFRALPYTIAHIAAIVLSVWLLVYLS